MNETETFSGNSAQPVVAGTNKFLNWARYAFMAASALALIVVIPTQWFPLQLGKVAIFATLLAIAAILFVVGGGMRTLMARRGASVAFATVALPVAYLISHFFSINKAIGFSGFGLETDTVLFTLLGFVALMLGFGLFRSMREIRQLLVVVFFSLIVAAVFQCFNILSGTKVLPFQPFADRSVNLIGKWNDLGLLVGLLAVWTMGVLEWMPLAKSRRILLVVLSLLLVVILGLVNFNLVWGLVLVFALVFGAIVFLARRPAEQPLSIKHIPWYASAAVVLSVVFLLFGTSINTGLSSMFPVSSLEVRPSYSSSVDILKAAHATSSTAAFTKNVLIGNGPDTFGQMWLFNKPAGVNSSLFWNLDFVVGFSHVVTAFQSVGLLGALAWLVPIVLALYCFLRVLRSAARTREEKLLTAALTAGVAYLWSSVVLYVPSQNLVLLAFVLTGVLISYAYDSEGQILEEQAKMKSVGFAVSAVVILATLVAGFAVDRLFMQQVNVNKGLIALNSAIQSQGDLAAAQNYAQKAGNTPDALRLITQIGLARLQQISAQAQKSQKAPPELVQQFAEAASSTIAAGNQAIGANPLDYRSYILMGQVYEYLLTQQVQRSYQLAEQAYYVASVLNPSNPQIPLYLARLEASQNNLQLTQTFLQKSLTLKPNYTDAILFAVQLYVAQKDLPNAIAAAKAAVQSAPGVASIWFELGLLYYAGGDTKDAIEPLKQAISIQPDYANAKYFLGLSQYAQGDKESAIANFQDLQKTNPDNQEVQLILSNMQAGKAPFTAAQPPVTPNPEKRATAPVSE